MRFELKDFQQRAENLLLDEIREARGDIVRRGRPQAIVLSSPTGSGKTITMSAVIERTLTHGDPERGYNPEATFLWFSDSPELNAQSRDKIARACDGLPERRLVMIDTDFDQKTLDPGVVYFLNMQKLARTSLLLRKGDERDWTIWETIANSIERSPENLYMIIDEAHRGMTAPDDLAVARTIVQKFILGNSDIPPVPLILGMSATPQRFDDLIGAQANRVRRPIPIDPVEVRESGLLKDRITLIHPGEDQPSDFSLLAHAVRSWRTFTEAWGEYCAAEAELEVVRPLLVIQVEDGTETRPTRTDLTRLIGTVRECYPELGPRGLVHSFDLATTVESTGISIRKVEPSKLQEDPEAEIVLFKRALTTGWDCPRAEVIMSFRRAVDSTMIAQLVGRMVRSPLARRIEGDDSLNAVELYLPYYDDVALTGIIETLSEPDPQAQMPMEVERAGEGVNYPRTAGMDEIFALIEALPSYRISRAPKQSEAKRLLRLGFLLTTRDGLDDRAQDEAVDALISVLETQRDRLQEEDDFAARVIETGEIEVREVTYDLGLQEATGDSVARIPASTQNINDLFTQMGRRLAPGEGLHTAFWKRNHRDDEPLRGKIEFIVTAQDPDAVEVLETRAADTFDGIYERNKSAIAALGEREREAYAHLQGIAKRPVTFPVKLPNVLHERRGSGPLTKHLYSNADAEFEAPLNTWEMAILAIELAKDETLAWLRNQDRKPWAISIPYDDRGHTRPFYPDFLLVRKGADSPVVDIVEPHDLGRDDSWKKARGLAQYAAEHGTKYGRLLIGIVDGDRPLMVNANERRVRERLLRLTSNDELRNLIIDSQ